MTIKTGHALMAVFLLSAILISGCGTVKGAAQGVVQGVREDWKTAQNWDAWMRKNLW